MLQRQVEVGADVGVGRYRVQQRVVHPFWLHVHDAEPRARMALGQRRHQRGQARRLFEVGAPAPRVLSDQHDLPHAARHVRVHLGAHVLQGKAAVAPADEGDGAVGAEAVAPVRYLHVGRDRLGLGLLHACGAGQALASDAGVRLRKGPLADLVPSCIGARAGRRCLIACGQFREQALEHGCQVVLAGARHERARLGKLLFQVGAVAGRHAAGDHEGRPPALHVREARDVEDCLQAFLGGRLDERAGVDDHRVGAGRIVHHRIARLQDAGAHVCGVHLVLGAPEGQKRDRARRQGALGLAVAGFLHGSVAFPLRHR